VRNIIIAAAIVLPAAANAQTNQLDSVSGLGVCSPAAQLTVPGGCPNAAVSRGVPLSGRGIITADIGSAIGGSEMVFDLMPLDFQMTSPYYNQDAQPICVLQPNYDPLFGPDIANQVYDYSQRVNSTATGQNTYLDGSGNWHVQFKMLLPVLPPYATAQGYGTIKISFLCPPPE
jgi:hypothetical protein